MIRGIKYCCAPNHKSWCKSNKHFFEILKGDLINTNMEEEVLNLIREGSMNSNDFSQIKNILFHLNDDFSKISGLLNEYHEYLGERVHFLEGKEKITQVQALWFYELLFPLIGNMGVFIDGLIKFHLSLGLAYPRLQKILGEKDFEDEVKYPKNDSNDLPF